MAKHTLFPGAGEPFHVFQDDIFEDTTPMTSHAPMPSFETRPRRPLNSVDLNALIESQPRPQFPQSPFKMKNLTRSPLKPTNGKKLNKVSMPPPGSAIYHSHTDSLKKPVLSKFNTRPKKSGHESKSQWEEDSTFGQGSPLAALAARKPMHNRSSSSGSFIKFGPPIQGPGSIAEPSSDQPEQSTVIPAWDSFPPIADDGTKPPHSYAQMIAMALFRSPTRRLTLAQIYKWISDTFAFYKPNDSGWQNSIRHNLSLHKSFIKVERPKEDPGKGHYWTIQPGTEGQFLKDKPKGKSVPSAENLPVMSTRLEPSRPTPVPTSEPCLPPPAPVDVGPSQSTQHLRPIPSSDATISDAENTYNEDVSGEHQPDNSALFNSVLYSPAPAGLNSSPPVAWNGRSAHGAPSARPLSRKRAAEDDSGYISSLDSSVIRPKKSTVEFTPEDDMPRKRRKHNPHGRAEVEIARLRNSSPFSPTKSRSKSVSRNAPSSPLRPITSPLRPLNRNRAALETPVKMPPPMQHPPSVSPNTNLKNHRNAVQGMLKSAALAADENEAPWSPEFKLDDLDTRDYAHGANDDDLLPLDWHFFRGEPYGVDPDASIAISYDIGCDGTYDTYDTAH